MKLIILTIAFVCTFVHSSNSIAKRQANQFCFEKNRINLKTINTSAQGKEKVEEMDSKTRSIIYLSDNYKSCEWNTKLIHAEVRLNEYVTLEANYIFDSFDSEKKDSVIILDVSDFSYYKLSNGVSSKKKYEYNEFVSQTLKNSVGKTFLVNAEIKVKCPKDIKDVNHIKDTIFHDYYESYFSGSATSIKIDYPITIVGECSEYIEKTDDTLYIDRGLSCENNE